MRKASQPIAAYVFDTIGIIAWIAAIWWFYREETMQTTVTADGFPNGVVNEGLLHLQNDMLVLSCTLAIIGTLFIGFSAVVKQIYASRISSMGN